MAFNWESMYQEKLRSAEDAAQLIKNGDKLLGPTGDGTPRMLWHHIAKRIKNGELSDCETLFGFNLNATDMCKPEAALKCHHIDGYITPLSRPLAQKGIIDPWPTRFSDMPRILSEYRDSNVATFTVSPMDKHGYFSVGLNASHVYSVTRRALRLGKPMKIFVEVNKNYPYTYGNNHIHISEVAALNEADWELIALPSEKPNEKDIAIAAYIAEHIPDGACLQLGIGGIPNAVGQQLANKKDLGCHTEMIVDAYLQLYKSGALTNRKKNFMPDKMIGSLVFGSKELYEFVDHNPAVEIHGIDFAVNPNIAAQNDNLIAINSIMECDLSGQCISESVGTVPYTGMGGQQDFVQAAWQSKGGKSFLTMYSTYTDKNGVEHSKISPLVNGWISINRWDVQHIATEYGCVNLKGASMRERVEKIVSIAHPGFREWLVFEAKKLNLIDSTSDINIKHMRREM